MASFPTALQRNASLQAYHSFGCKVQAAGLAGFSGVEQIPELVAEAALPSLLVLGGGSNVLFTRNYPGLVLLNRIMGMRVEKEDEQHIYLRVGAGENWHQLVLHCVDKGWGGIENLSLIPGCVGASPMQNIGAYGAEVKDVIDEVEAWHLPDQQVIRFNNSDCRFGYRNSIFKQELKNLVVISSVRFRLQKQPKPNTAYGAIRQQLEAMQVSRPGIADVSRAVIAIRQSKLPDPKEIGNAGSFFKNPVVKTAVADELLAQFPEMPGYPDTAGYTKIPAGWLIEKAGLKGYRQGDAGVHQQQALVIVNHGSASGEELLAVAQLVQKKVSDMFGISLEKEVNILP